MFVTTTTTLSR